MENLCRLCLTDIGKAGYKINFTSGNFVSIKEKLIVLFPEMDFDATENSELCGSCYRNLQICYNFKTKCLRIYNNQKENNLSSNSDSSDLSALGPAKLNSEKSLIGDDIEQIEDGINKSNFNEYFKVYLKKYANSKRYSCTRCSRIFSSEFSARYHFIRTRHHQNYNIECQVCSKIFTTTCELRDHMKLHVETEEKKFHKCYVCNKMFKNKSDVFSHVTNNHKLVSSRARVKCSLCKVIVSSIWSLQQHIVVKHPEKEPYICHCGRNYFSLRAFNSHQKFHSNETPYRCSICSMYFKNKNTKVNHERGHTAITFYKCEHCSYNTNRLGGLKSHLKLIHNLSD